MREPTVLPASAWCGAREREKEREREGESVRECVCVRERGVGVTELCRSPPCATVVAPTACQRES